jgi:enoyl-CoA hydratase
MAAQLCETGPLALRAITRSLRELQTHVPEAEAMRRSDELAGPVFASQDAREGMRAFKEKRKAVFQGK